MNQKIFGHYLWWSVGAVLFVLLCPGAALASTNISSSTNAHWGWNDVVGWIDFYNTQNITVSSAALTGYASSSAGYVSLDCHTSPASSTNICSSQNGNYQVLNDGAGHLSGWAWNDGVGWISFWSGNGGSGSYRVNINSSGYFSGYAWNDLIGWISFNCSDQAGLCIRSDYKVQTAWVTTSTTGFLDSATFDTGAAGGAQLNSVLWHGSLPTGAAVGFQFAVSNVSSGPWSFIGPGGATSTYWNALFTNLSVPLDYSLYNNFRYFRYRVTLFSDISQTLTPRVDDVIVNWSP